MFEKLVVALDGSDESQVTLPYAEEIAAKLGSQIVLLEVCDSPKGCSGSDGQPYLEKVLEKMRHSWAQHSASGGSGTRHAPELQLKVLTGNAADAIIDFATRSNAGLILMSTTGRSGTSRWAVGSVADKVLRATRIPIALVNTASSDGSSKPGPVMTKALLPLDGSGIGEAALPYVEELALKMDTELLLLQVLEFKYMTYGAEIGGYVPYPQEWVNATEEAARSYLRGLEGRLKSKGIKASWRLESGMPADTILQVAEQSGVDYIAMSTHGRSGVGRWVFGSVADRVVHSAKFPVFVVRAQPSDTKSGDGK
ncbi:MAG: universal stress protein [Dehalococcoidia bacterium]|nr:universal stress protein [Dehalococcoidia bacterium]